ncbi:MAG: hypothetical protein R6V44_14110 [Paracoccaceae bacterium]
MCEPLARKAEIDGMLARLKALSEDHFDAHPDELTWADVGSLGHVRERLREICDFAFSEASCAPDA